MREPNSSKISKIEIDYNGLRDSRDQENAELPKHVHPDIVFMYANNSPSRFVCTKLVKIKVDFLELIVCFLPQILSFLHVTSDFVIVFRTQVLNKLLLNSIQHLHGCKTCYLSCSNVINL
jgi:hypothetical protein